MARTIPRAVRVRLRQRIDAFDPLAQHALLGAAVGLGLVALLVPVLQYWKGAQGPLGASIPLFFLVPVLLASASGGGGVGALISVVAIAVWDWYFIPPFYTITIYYPRDVLALLVFLAVALLVGQLSTATRRRAEEALRRARGSEALYELSLALITRTDPADVLPTLARRLRDTFDLQASAVLLPDERDLTWRTAASAGDVPPDLRVEESRAAAATASWVNGSGHASGWGRMGGVRLSDGRILRPHVRQGRARFLPLRVGTRSIGVLELVYSGDAPRDADREHLLETFANGAAIALEQERLAAEERAAEMARQSDSLKSALLSSVSHDLRTPLAGIKAAASSLLQKDVQWSEADRDAFLTDIDHEADRLTRLVSNLLDLSRIEAGAIKPVKEWEDVGELVERVLRRLALRLTNHPILREIAPDLPPIRIDAVQMEQVLVNLIENAARYSPTGAPITVGARVTDDSGAEVLALSVADQGAGIPASERSRIFDKFYRVAASARGTGGTGMGLAIVKGLAEANGGRVTVASTPGEGSVFTVLLPITDRAPVQPDRSTRDAPAAGRVSS